MTHILQTMMVGSFFMSIFVLVFGFLGAFVFLSTVGYYQEYKDRKQARLEQASEDSEPAK